MDKAKIGELNGLNINELKGVKLRASTHKLLSTGIAALAEANHIGEKGELTELVVSLDLLAYAKECGCDLEIKEADFRREVIRDLKTLLYSTLSWEDETTEDFDHIRILGSAELSDSEIILGFSYSFANAILKQSQPEHTKVWQWEIWW